MNPIIVLGVVAGAWIVPTVARFNPTLVNGFLILLLVGIVFGNSNRWLPILTAFGNATSTALSVPNTGTGTRIRV